MRNINVFLETVFRLDWEETGAKLKPEARTRGFKQGALLYRHHSRRHSSCKWLASDTRGPTPQTSVLCIDVLGDGVQLDVGSSFIYCTDLCIAEEFLHRVIFGVADPSHPLNALACCQPSNL